MVAAHAHSMPAGHETFPATCAPPAGHMPHTSHCCACFATTQGTLCDMLEDVNTGIAWVLNNAELYRGDPRCVYITGQSAGAQLGALALMAQVGSRWQFGIGKSGACGMGRAGRAQPMALVPTLLLLCSESQAPVHDL